MKNFCNIVQPYFQHKGLILTRHAGFTYISWTITDQALASNHKSYPLPRDCASLIPYVERTEGYESAISIDVKKNYNQISRNQSNNESNSFCSQKNAQTHSRR